MPGNCADPRTCVEHVETAHNALSVLSRVAKVDAARGVDADIDGHAGEKAGNHATAFEGKRFGGSGRSFGMNDKVVSFSEPEMPHLAWSDNDTVVAMRDGDGNSAGVADIQLRSRRVVSLDADQRQRRRRKHDQRPEPEPIESFFRDGRR